MIFGFTILSHALSCLLCLANHRAQLSRDPADRHQQAWSQPDWPEDQGWCQQSRPPGVSKKNQRVLFCFRARTSWPPTPSRRSPTGAAETPTFTSPSATWSEAANCSVKPHWWVTAALLSLWGLSLHRHPPTPYPNPQSDHKSGEDQSKLSSLFWSSLYKNTHALNLLFVYYRATKWTTYWRLTSARCWPRWTSSVLDGLRPSELLTGGRPPSSSGSCALLASLAAGGGPLPTSCGGWVSVLLLALTEPTPLQIPPPRAATTPWKAPATVTSATRTWMKMSRLVRMTTSKSYSTGSLWVSSYVLSHGGVHVLLLLKTSITSLPLILLKHVCSYYIWFWTIDNLFFMLELWRFCKILTCSCDRSRVSFLDVVIYHR